jgi:DNA repair exonuclease SbcCD ATPase subunit
MKIEIKSMTLQNFKKVRSQEIGFSHNMVISGANKVGKTTIYDAYLWAIFGIISKKNAIVQPLDINNDVIHHLETSVTVVLNYNDEREVKVQRILSENWKNKGTADEKLQSTTQERLINDVPLSQKDFNAKLEELCPLNKWLVLSNINIFMSYKVDDRRKMLMSLAGKINKEELMKPYPIVYKGVIEEKKELSDMLTQQKATKKKAEEELDLIPAKVQAQEALRVDADFAALKAQKAKIDADIAVIDAALEGTTEKDPAMEAYINKLQKHNIKVANAQKIWQDAKIKAIDELTKKISTVSTAITNAESTQTANIETNKKNKIILADVVIKFNDKVKEWNNVNEKEFSYQQTDVCPVCGRLYTEEMKAREYENAVAEFNKNKSDILTKLQNEAAQIKQQMTVLKGNINTYEQITKAQDEDNVKKVQSEYEKLINERTEKQNQTWEAAAEKAILDKKLADIEASKPVVKVDATMEENKEKKKALVSQRDGLVNKIADEKTNKRIDTEKEKLNNRSVELSQIIADCGEVINQIKAYKKAKINLVEQKVNSYFSIIRWKFYEQNKTNDDEKEICTAIDKDGIDYDNTNDGTVIDMGVDIISGISKASNIFVPLFVDRKESAEHIVPVEQQIIYLQCIYGQPLEIKSL